MIIGIIAAVVVLGGCGVLLFVKNSSSSSSSDGKMRDGGAPVFDNPVQSHKNPFQHAAPALRSHLLRPCAHHFCRYPVSSRVSN